jgi:hypothetical protein
MDGDGATDLNCLCRPDVGGKNHVSCFIRSPMNFQRKLNFEFGSNESGNLLPDAL